MTGIGVPAYDSRTNAASRVDGSRFTVTAAGRIMTSPGSFKPTERVEGVADDLRKERQAPANEQTISRLGWAYRPGARDRIVPAKLRLTSHGWLVELQRQLTMLIDCIRQTRRRSTLRAWKHIL